MRLGAKAKDCEELTRRLRSEIRQSVCALRLPSCQRDLHIDILLPSRFESIMARTSSDADLSLLTIREVGLELGVTLRALRFYEAKGMIAPKREGWRRLYHTTDVERLRKIAKLKILGLSLREIREMLQSPPANGPYGLTEKLCATVFHRLSVQRAEAEAGLTLLADAGCRCGTSEQRSASRHPALDGEAVRSFVGSQADAGRD